MMFLVRGLRGRGFGRFLIFGMGLMLFLNVRYVIEGVPAGIAFFVGIYDVLINIGLGSADSAAAVTACVGNECSVWGDRFAGHPAWGVAFYERFTTGPTLRTNLLYGHIVCNSLAFILLHLQLLRPGGTPEGGRHALLGRVTFGLTTISVICAVWLASEHGAVAEYGGSLSTWGFYSMAAFVYAMAVMGVLAIRRGDAASHRVWMFRFAGSMWGSFWLFRVTLFVIDPLLRNYESAAILICIWGSAPAGILIAEIIRRRLDNRGPEGAVSAAE